MNFDSSLHVFSYEIRGNEGEKLISCSCVFTGLMNSVILDECLSTTMLLGVKSISRKSEVTVSCHCNAMPRFWLFLRCPFQIQDRKRGVFLRYRSVSFVMLVLPAESPSGGQGGVLSVLRQVCVAWVGGQAARRDACELHPPLGWAVTAVGIPGAL